MSAHPEPLHVWCGPYVFAWRMNDAELQERLAGLWARHLTDRAAQVTITVRAEALRQGAAGTLEPLVVSDGPDDVRTLQFGTLLAVRWRLPADEMVCAYDTSVRREELPAILDSLYATLSDHWLRRRGEALLHAAGILRDDGTADLFVGYSGAGKTTLAASVPPERVLHDDTMILTQRGGTCQVASAPWQSNRWAAPAGRSWPVGRVFVLHRQGPQGVTSLPPLRALAALLRVGLFPSSGLTGSSAPVPEALAVLAQRHACLRFRYVLRQDDPWAWLDPVAAA